MSYAKLFLKGEDRDLGYFHFVSMPRSGEMIAINVNGAPATFTVEGIVHLPVTGESFGKGASVPSSTLIVAKLQMADNK